MFTLNNLTANISDTVFSMTRFNFDITESKNEDGTVNITFDCDADLAKFKSLYAESIEKNQPKTEYEELKDTVKELIDMYKTVLNFVVWKDLGKELDTHVNLGYADARIVEMEKSIK